MRPNPSRRPSIDHPGLIPGRRVVLKSRPPTPVAIDLAAAVRKEVILEAVSYGTFSESLDFLTRHDVADLFGEVRPLEDFANAFAADDVGENLKSFLSPDPIDANLAPPRHIAKVETVPAPSTNRRRCRYHRPHQGDPSVN